MKPDELESVDIDDPKAVKQALADAAARIRELEQEGVRAVGGTVAEMLNQAAKLGDEILDKAKADAQTTRSAAEAAAGATQANAAAEAQAIVDAATAQAATIQADAQETAAGTITRATTAADGIAAKADAIARSTQVISDAQERLDRLLTAERDVHDRLQAAMSDIQTSVLRVGVSQDGELDLTVEDPEPVPAGETVEPSDEISARLRSA